ncbi:MAG TPA: hypothetical protein ENJ09_13755, partial [Planctomycetes bacterium]|nr:hypothetical protein [Planctomycetota bacterium]
MIASGYGAGVRIRAGKPAREEQPNPAAAGLPWAGGGLGWDASVVRGRPPPPSELDFHPIPAYLAAPFSGTSSPVLFTILTLFPEAIEPYLDSSILGIARAKGAVEVRLVDFRDFTRDRHRTVDDRPYGGGPGMVLKPEPILDCVEWLEREDGPFRKILLSPQGS